MRSPFFHARPAPCFFLVDSPLLHRRANDTDLDRLPSRRPRFWPISRHPTLPAPDRCPDRPDWYLNARALMSSADGLPGLSRPVLAVASTRRRRGPRAAFRAAHAARFEGFTLVPHTYPHGQLAAMADNEAPIMGGQLPHRRLRPTIRFSFAYALVNGAGVLFVFLFLHATERRIAAHVQRSCFTVYLYLYTGMRSRLPTDPRRPVPLLASRTRLPAPVSCRPLLAWWLTGGGHPCRRPGTGGSAFPAFCCFATIFVLSKDRISFHASDHSYSTSRFYLTQFFSILPTAFRLPSRSTLQPTYVRFYAQGRSIFKLFGYCNTPPRLLFSAALPSFCASRLGAGSA